MFIEIVSLAVLLVLSAFFAGTETAYTSISAIRIQNLVERGVKRAKLVQSLKEDTRDLIITILIGNNLVNIAASSIATVLGVALFGSTGVGIAIGATTLIILVFGEITPKSLAVEHREWIVLNSAPLIYVARLTFLPLTRVLTVLSNVMTMPFKTKKRPEITEDEIMSAVNIGETIGEVESDEKQMIHNIFRFSDLKAKDIMVPSKRVFFLDPEISLREALPKLTKHNYTRVPVVKDDMIGMIYMKDVLKKVKQGKVDEPVKRLMRKAVVVSENIFLDDLLRMMQRQKVHLAIVMGKTIKGIVTLEDLMEEIVGELYDESDSERIIIRKVDKGFLVHGHANLNEIRTMLGLDLGETSPISLSRLIEQHFKRKPRKGDRLKLGKADIFVEKTRKGKVKEVFIR